MSQQRKNFKLDQRPRENKPSTRLMKVGPHLKKTCNVPRALCEITTLWAFCSEQKHIPITPTLMISLAGMLSTFIERDDDRRAAKDRPPPPTEKASAFATKATSKTENFIMVFQQLSIDSQCSGSPEQSAKAREPQNHDGSKRPGSRGTKLSPWSSSLG